MMRRQKRRNTRYAGQYTGLEADAPAFIGLHGDHPDKRKQDISSDSIVPLTTHMLLLKGQPKFQWCCGAFAVAITVMMTALMVTLISSSPLIFLRLSEITQGELDFAVYPLDAPSLNYTQIEALIFSSNDSQYFRNSPRITASASVYSAARCMNQSDELGYFVPAWKYVGIDSAPCNTTGTWIDLFDAECNMTDRSWSQHSCFDFYCRQTSRPARVFLIDSDRERAMQLGRNWNYPKIPRNCTYVHQQLASSLGLSVGDVIYLQFNPSDFFSLPFRQYSFGVAFAAFQVCEIFSDPKGKDEATGTPNWIFVEYESFLEYIIDQLHPETPPELLSMLRNSVNPYHYAHTVGFQAPEDFRMKAYLQRNFDTMDQMMYGEYGSNLMLHLGFLEVGLNPNFVYAMRDKETLSLAFSMIMMVVVCVMMLLCVSLKKKKKISCLLLLLLLDLIF